MCVRGGDSVGRSHAGVGVAVVACITLVRYCSV
jgi:hypothetical protein